MKSKSCLQLRWNCYKTTPTSNSDKTQPLFNRISSQTKDRHWIRVKESHLEACPSSSAKSSPPTHSPTFNKGTVPWPSRSKRVSPRRIWGWVQLPVRKNLPCKSLLHWTTHHPTREARSLCETETGRLRWAIEQGWTCRSLATQTEASSPCPLGMAAVALYESKVPVVKVQRWVTEALTMWCFRAQCPSTTMPPTHTTIKTWANNMIVSSKY